MLIRLLALVRMQVPLAQAGGFRGYLDELIGTQKLDRLLKQTGRKAGTRYSRDQ